ncbi:MULTISPECIES: ArsR/SmtB family transcription factor [Lachnospiraceae]|jgi:DNA-binding transcriptional ArsR family regulator|uniref:Metalloregulator ArsR/SmtB family transcription factor n=1 Tax=Faecalicatena acetigenes TaxID=2981790 RepID=A0ABT2T7K3_9FIRM|nr:MULTISPECIES: metalloregulator ArsR/SmtB family transcription factor [Lachnospiraceae]MCU6746250.1 metalloregulator ArsR/SmtB family transcription factor [Faecalicatena acetigenes]RGT75143.1 transcriptional regulator [Ruminococcus sp. AF18-22]SCH03597.1 Transcriptional repressor smtB homolog [uncultured Clostridium sp.]
MDRIEVEHCDHIHVHADIVKNVQEHMPREEELRDLADFFKVFGDTTRIRILCTLFQTEMCVCDLAQTLDMTQSAISHQLRILKQMKLVANRREGKTVFYSLADGHIKTIMDQGMEHIRE